MPRRDTEANRFSARAARYARVGANMGGVAARIAATRIFGLDRDRIRGAVDLAAALGGLKGPIMKVAQLMATVPDLLPPEYAAELTKLQYPDMQSAVEADLQQLDWLFAIHRRMDPAIDTTEIAGEIGARIREELDYQREAKHVALYRAMLTSTPEVRVPRVWPAQSTRRLLTLDWLEGNKLLAHKSDDIAARNRIAVAMFKAWWQPFSRFGVIHGDPHLGNYTVFIEGGTPDGINLLDYGCIRIFPSKFVGGVVDLYHGLLKGDEALVVHAYETWGFRRLSRQLVDTLNIWARFIYGPLLDDRERTIADGVKPSEYGRREAFRVHRALKEKGPVRVPREFVFMDRAAIGLGGVFLHLAARLNFHHLFSEAIEKFAIDRVAERQRAALEAAGLGADEG